MRRAVTFTLIAILVAAASFANIEEKDAVKEEIRQAVTDAYINGVFIKGDAEAMKKGWHAESNMFINAGDKLNKWPVKNWIKVIEQQGPVDPNAKYEFPIIDYTENTAVVKVEVSMKGKLTYSDYLTLYKFKDGWKIIAKTYYEHSHNAPTQAEDKELIQKAVMKGYVNGMFVTGDVNDVMSGWQRSCIVNIYNPKQDNIRQMPIQQMFNYFEKNGGIAPDVKHEFKLIDHVGYAGFVIVEIHYGGKHVYSDYMHVYKFKDGWKIATKVYFDHRTK